MHLNPYGEYAVQMAARLANDWPATRAELVLRTREFGVRLAYVERADDLARSRAVVDDWLRVVDASDDDERAGLLNAQIARAAATPYLTDHDGEGWHLHYRDPAVDDLPRLLAATISVGTALHLTERGMHRLGRCAADPCTRVVVDLSRNGTQRYCSPRCGSRDAVRRHRARLRA